MSGTSVDAVDVAVVEVARPDEETLAVRLLAYAETPVEESLRGRVFDLFSPERSRVDEICQVNVLLGEQFAIAAAKALIGTGLKPDLVASHGQTIWHHVEEGRAHSTLQIGEPSVLAELLQTTVVADFRPRDVAAGGQGAPLASWFDALLFRDPLLDRAAQNIGGIGNVTWVPAPGGQGEVAAFDTGPGNSLIDAAVAHLTDGAKRFDEDGAMAARGTPDEGLLRKLLSHSYFVRVPPKTTGREQFGSQLAVPFVERASSAGLSPGDIVATLTAFTARAIADQYRRFLPRLPDEIVVGGGGARNPTLMRMLAEALAPARLKMIEDFGISAGAKEAVFFALLGYEALHGRPNTLPACTGAAHPVVMGKVLPGPNYRELAARVASATSASPLRLEMLT